MSRKHFSILLVVSIVVAAVVVLIPRKTGHDAAIEPRVFLPELAARINDVEAVRISASGGNDVVTMERTEEGWVVRESSSYPADWSVLKPLLAGLSQAEVIEEKTADPEYYDRLGVDDPMQEGADSKLVEFPRDESLPAVIIGDHAQGRQGQYMRRQGDARSVLVDRVVDLPFEASGWLQRDIVDIDDADVVALTITHADGEVVHIERPDTEVTDFTLSDIPEGRDVRSAWTVNQLASTLSGLTLDAVVPQDEVDWSEALSLELRTGSGLDIQARLAEDEEHRWIRLEAAGSDEAVAINQRVGGWAYRIPIYKYDAINKRMDDLLAVPEEEEEQ